MSKATTVLLDEYFKLGGILFGEFVLRQKGNDELKKTFEANDFLMGMMKGEFKKEWRVEDSEEYKAMMEIADAINQLEENKET